MWATGRIDQRGFTLLEMLVVLAVLALLSGIAFPAVERAIAQQRFRLAVAEAQAGLRDARAVAVARDRVTPFAPADTAGVTLALPRGGLRFYPDGSADGGAVVLTDGRLQARIEVDAATGMIGGVR